MYVWTKLLINSVMSEWINKYGWWFIINWYCKYTNHAEYKSKFKCLSREYASTTTLDIQYDLYFKFLFINSLLSCSCLMIWNHCKINPNTFMLGRKDLSCSESQLTHAAWCIILQFHECIITWLTNVLHSALFSEYCGGFLC